MLAVVAIAGVVALWWLIGVVFSSDRGLDLHDEGLYLLGADHGNLRGTWTTPFGWHTRPFFLLLGRSVESLRTFAVLASAASGAWAAWSIARTVTEGRTRADRTTRTMVAVVGAVAGPMVAASMLRTPGYNWVNLVGLTVAAGGIAMALGIPAEAEVRSRAMWVPATLVAAGAFFAIPGKPTSAIAVAVVGAAVLATRMPLRRVARFAGAAVAVGVLLIAFAVVARVWPADFLSVLRTGSKVPPLHENQSIGGALRDVLRTPKVALEDLRRLRAASLLLMAIAAATAWWAPRLPPAARWVPLSFATVAAVGTAAPLPLLGGPSPAYRFAWYGTTNGAVLLLAGAALHVLAHRQSADRATVRRAAVVALMLLALTVAFGLGSAMSVYHQAALATVLLWPAAAVVATAVGGPRRRAATAAVLAVAAFAMAATNLVDSRRHPFLYPDIATATAPLTLGDGDRLLVEPDTASHLTELRAAARGAGFCPGERLLGFLWQWSATEQYVLDATVPDTLLLTIFGYPDPLRVLDQVLTDLDRDTWSGAWLLTTDPATLAPDDAAELDAALRRLPSAVGRTFPEDYVMAAHVGDTQLWRPAGPAPAPCT